MDSQPGLRYDALVLGGGIAGLEAALNLADQDFSVAIVEKDASIGGKMIRLSKVFPTLDCSSCITTPKMAAAAHHPNITLLTYCELGSLSAGATIWWPRFAKAPLCGRWTFASAAASANINVPCWRPMPSKAGLRPVRPFTFPSPTPFPRRP